MKKNESENIIHRLRYRELVDFNSKTSPYHTNRRFYQDICPNLTVINIDAPPCFLKKFTPDGKLLLGFSNDQSSLYTYSYHGPSAANELIETIPIEQFLLNRERVDSESVRSRLFSLFFKLKNVVPLTINNEKLSRDCSLFTNNSRYVIVVSSVRISPQEYPTYSDTVNNDESCGLKIRPLIENYRIHLVDIVEGRKCHELIFKRDYILLSHSQGIYLHNNTLVVLSTFRQTINIYNIVDCNEKGKRFQFIKFIGRINFPEDKHLITNTLNPVPSTSALNISQILPPASKNHIIGLLKHKFLDFLYRRALKESPSTGERIPIGDFYRKFDHYLSLRISKFQLLDEDHLLIKYEPGESITSRSSESNNYPFYLCAYQLSTGTMLQVYRNDSVQLVDIYEGYCSYFRNTRTYICSSSNDFYARELARECRRLLTEENGQLGATHQILSFLPIPPQSYNPSPYFDLSLFRFDDRLVSPLERPKKCGENPIRFFIQNTQLLRFRIHTDTHPPETPDLPQKLIGFTFHPFDPFIISLQKTEGNFILNFHFRSNRF